MADTQESNKPSYDEGILHSKQIHSLQDRFAALSHLASLTPKKDKGESSNTTTSHNIHSNNLKGRVMRRYEQERQHEPRLDHSPPPIDDINIARKRQKGLQGSLGYVSENAPLPSIQSSGSHILNPLASPFDVIPTREISQSTLTISQISMGFLALEPIRKSHRPRRAGKFTMGSLVVEIDSAEGDIRKVGENIQSIKIDTDDQSFQFAPEVEEHEEIPPENNPIKPKPLGEEFGTPSLGITTSSTVISEEPGFKQFPNAILSRYPKMAKYLVISNSQENSAKQVAPDSPAPLLALLPQGSVREREGEEIPKIKNEPVEFALQSKGTPALIVKKEHSPCSNILGLLTTQVISLGTEGTRPIYEIKIPMFEKIFSSRSDKSHEPGVKNDTVQPNGVLSAPSLKILTEVTIPGKELEEVVSSLPEKRLEQSFSARPTLPERYAIPVRPQDIAATTPKVSARVESDGREDGKISQVVGKDPLMEQLVMIDERFSRDLEGNLNRHACSLSRRSSVSSDASITFSFVPEGPAALTRASKYTDKADFGDLDRLRRSMNPSPSPHQVSKVASLAPATGSMHPIDFGLTGKSKNRVIDQKNMVGNWLNRFSSSGKDTGPHLSRSQPSILARIHGSVLGDDEGDSDGIAPGEWIKPVELLKKPKTGSIIQPESPVTPPVLGPLLGLVKGSISSTTRLKGSGNPGYPHPKPLHSTARQSSVPVDHNILVVSQPHGRANNVGTSAIVKVKEKEMVTREWQERGITEIAIVNEKPHSDLRRPFVEDDWQRKSGSEQARGGWRASREGGLFASPPSSIYGASSLLSKAKTQTASGRGRSARDSSSSVLTHHVHQPQHQEAIDPIKDVADTLRIIKMQNEMSRTGAVISPVPNASGSSTQKRQGATGQSPPISHVSMAPSVSHVQKESVGPALKPVSEKIPEVKQPLFVAYVRKLCPLFSAGLCYRGQNCLDLHPNYDEQSGTYNDKRFATKEAFDEEALEKARLEKERARALEELIRESRDDADRKCRGTQLGARFKPGKPRPMSLQVGSVVVSRNAKGEMDWTVKPPQIPEAMEEGPGPENKKPKKQGKRRAQV